MSGIRAHPYKGTQMQRQQAPGGGNAAEAQNDMPPQNDMEEDIMPGLVPIDEMDPVNPQPQERIGAVAGGGIGGDEAVDDRAIQGQIVDIEVVSEREIAAARERIALANEGIQRQQVLQADLLRLRREQQAILNDVRCLLPSNQGIRAAAELDQRRAIAPLVDMFFDAFRPFLTEAYDDDATFRECFGIAANVQLAAEHNLLRTGFELLLKESIVQGINRPQAAFMALTQLLFDNNPATILVSAGGSIVAIILARDVLLWFANTVLSVMTFGMLSVQGLTNLLCFVYKNCSLVNIRNLLIYLSVAPENAQQFILAIRHYNREQRQYIIMTIFLFGLNAVSRGLPAMDLGQINALFAQAGRYMDGIGMNDEQLREADAPIIEPADAAARAAAGAAAGAAAANPAGAAAAAANPAGAAAAAANPAVAANPAAAAAALPADAAGAAAALNNVGAPVVLNLRGVNLSIGAIFRQSAVDIRDFVMRTFRSGWSRGLRLTRYCLRDVFTLYLVRPPVGRGLVCDLVNVSGRVARWGVAAIQDRSAVLDPAKPTQEVIRLLAAVNGMDLRTVNDPARCEAALYEFGRNLKGISVGPNNDGREGAVRILEQNSEDHRLVYLTEAAAPGCLNALRAHFRRGAPTVNVERLQNACLGMRLFVFEQGMRSNILAAAVGRRVDAGHQEQGQDFNETQKAVLASESVQSMEEVILENNDTVTKNLFGRVRLMLQAFGIFQGEQLGRLGVVLNGFLPDEEPGVSPAQILARQRHAARMPHKEQVKSAVRASIVGSELPEERKQLIIEHLMEFIDDMNFDEIQQYVVGQNPREAIPQRFLESCRQFVNLPERIRVLQENSAAATTAVYSGLGRCAASLMNAAVVSSGAAADVARAGIGRVSGLFQSVFGEQADRAAAVVVDNVARRVPPEEAAQHAAAVPGAAIIANIQLAQQIPEVIHGLAHSQDPDAPIDAANEGGRSRSRKRSASRATRRKGKQSSKKLKHKSRRYVRRRRSTRRKN